MASFDKAEYDKQFLKDNYDTIALRIPKGRKNDLKILAALHDTSVNRLIVEAIESYYHVDLSAKS